MHGFDDGNVDAAIVCEQSDDQKGFVEVEQNVNPNFEFVNVSVLGHGRGEEEKESEFVGQQRSDHRSVVRPSEERVKDSEDKVPCAQLRDQRRVADDSVSVVVHDLRVELRVNAVRKEKQTETHQSDAEAEKHRLRL